MAVRREVSSGAIVYKATNRGVFVAFVRDSVGKMTFPKGHIRKGETIEETARREVGEEAGLTNLRLVRRLGQIRISFIDRFVHKGNTIEKDIHYFLFEARADAKLKKMKLSDGEKIRAVKWAKLEDTDRLSEYADMIEIVQKAMALIKRQVERKKI
ncbi:MAG: NUDIX domain-containing protein [Patescibacteria group bacterium]